MKSYLLKMRVNGIKSIDKEVELSFYKNLVDKDFDVSDYHVKAIYGSNGAGKTGIIYAVEIYKNILFDSSYLALCNRNSSLENLINQTTKSFSIKMTFAYVVNNVRRLFEHSIIIEKRNERFCLTFERLDEITGSRVNDQSKKKVVFCVEEGKLILNEKFKNSLQLIDKTYNLLYNQSLSSYLIENYIETDSYVEYELKASIASIICLYDNLTIVLQNEDKNYINISSLTSQIESYFSFSKEVDKNTFAQLYMRDRLPNNTMEKIKIESFATYQNLINNMKKFIKIFMPSLVDIEIKTEENNGDYDCQNILVYEDGRRINKKYESTGIKKLITLYSALCDLEQGKIVFIDEFDANIHDVLLVKLVEYITEYTDGQFIFTTHNLAPMDFLQKKKNSLDFLSSDSKITSWKKCGNYSASSLYRNGLIEHSPFNIESFSFLGSFGGDNKK